MILLDYKDRRPIYEQIVDKMQELMVKGILEADSQLPSVRSLAIELSINPNTIQRAYMELERQGFIYSVKGRGSFVAPRQAFMGTKIREVQEGIEKLVALSQDLGMTKETFFQMIQEEYDRNQKTEPMDADSMVLQEARQKKDAIKSHKGCQMENKESEEPQ